MSAASDDPRVLDETPGTESNALNESPDSAAPSVAPQQDAEALRDALDRIAKLPARVDRVASKTAPEWRELWIRVGEVLAAQKKSLPSTKKFGDWIHLRGLDQGPLKDARVRSEAIWMAENAQEIREIREDDFPRGELSRCTSPKRFHSACREAGFEWARSPKREVKPKPPKVDWEQKYHEAEAEIDRLKALLDEQVVAA